jgi:hypothetical protein
MAEQIPVAPVNCSPGSMAKVAGGGHGSAATTGTQQL